MQRELSPLYPLLQHALTHFFEIGMFLDVLGANPFITTKGVAEKLAVAFTTALRAIERLEWARIVKRVGDAKRDRVYCATALLDILEEPARIKPDVNK